MWKIKFTYTQEGPQSLHVKLDMTCPWRADLHSFREKPDEDVTREKLDMLPTHGAATEYEASGVATDADGSLTYAGGGTTSSPWDGGMSRASFWARFDPSDTTKMQVYQLVILSSGLTQTGKNEDGSKTSPLPVSLWKDMFDENDVYADYFNGNTVTVGTMRLKKDVEFDENFGIKAGSVGPFSLETDLGPITYTLKWEACPAKEGPVAEWAH
jgi:hypothetical protein